MHEARAHTHTHTHTHTTVLDFEVDMPRTLTEQQREGFRAVFAVAAGLRECRDRRRLAEAPRRARLLGCRGCSRAVLQAGTDVARWAVE